MIPDYIIPLPKGIILLMIDYLNIEGIFNLYISNIIFYKEILDTNRLYDRFDIPKDVDNLKIENYRSIEEKLNFLARCEAIGSMVNKLMKFLEKDIKGCYQRINVPFIYPNKLVKHKNFDDFLDKIMYPNFNLDKIIKNKKCEEVDPALELTWRECLTIAFYDEQRVGVYHTSLSGYLEIDKFYHQKNKYRSYCLLRDTEIYKLLYQILFINIDITILLCDKESENSVRIPMDNIL